MESLDEIKFKMSQIKLQTLEKQFSRSQSQYLQSIQILKNDLYLKTQKGHYLLQQLQSLKQQYEYHQKQVKQVLLKANSSSPQSKNKLDNTIDGTFESTSLTNNKKKYHHELKLKSQPIIILDSSPESRSKHSTRISPRRGPKQIQKPLNLRLQRIDEKVKQFEKNSFRRKYQLLKCKSNTSIPSEESSSNKNRRSYDFQKGTNKSSSNSHSFALRRSQKMLNNPQKPKRPPFRNF